MLAEEVNEGLRRCGFALDPHGVLAGYREWRMPLSAWRGVFADCLEGSDIERLARASVAFDFRQVAGELCVDLALTDIIREAPAHKAFMRGLAQLGTEHPLAARLSAAARGPASTSRSTACCPSRTWRATTPSRGGSPRTPRSSAWSRCARSDGEETEAERSLREAYTSMAHLQLRHHANAIRGGRPLGQHHRHATLRPLTRVDPAGSHARSRRRASRFPRLAAALR